MDDLKIIDLFFNRNESAIKETENKYKYYLSTISFNILKNKEDVKEILNQVYLKIWETIPPTRPNSFKAYISKIVRSLSIDLYRKNKSQKRGPSQYDLVYEELDQLLSDNSSPIDSVLEKELVNHINIFLETLIDRDRNIFISRYFYFDPIKDISKAFEISESNCKTILHRSRAKLKEYLEERGYDI